MKDRVSLRSTHPAPCSRLRQLLVSLRCGPLQSRFARQLPLRGSLYPDCNCVLLFHTGTAQNRSVGAPKYAVILNEVKDPVFCGFGVLFTGFFTAVAVQNDRCTGKGRRGRRPLQSGRKSGGVHVGAGVPDSPCAGVKNAVILNERSRRQSGKRDYRGSFAALLLRMTGFHCKKPPPAHRGMCRGCLLPVGEGFQALFSFVLWRF